MNCATSYLPFQIFKKGLIIIIFIFFTISLYSQYGTKAQLRNIDFELIEDKVIITYDLINARPKDLFDIEVGVFNTSGYKIEAQTLQGQFTDVTRGKKKQIEWFISEDYNNFEDNIYIELNAFHKNHSEIKRITRIEAVAKSTLWPGWGSSQTTLKKSNYVRGAFGYGFLTTAAIFNSMAKDERWRAANTNNSYKADLYKDNANYYQNVCYVNLGLAGFMWIWEYGKILFSPNVSKTIKLDIEANNLQNNLVPLLSLKFDF